MRELGIEYYPIGRPGAAPRTAAGESDAARAARAGA
ncbi:UDP-glucose 6-dehydrogenase 2 [Burkholderia pseudomallei]|nr:UDP-glucose 6-dehydrogenase 2 [Burkholderia pseudomallei]